MNYPFFVARRLFAQSGGKQQVSRPAIRIATAGVALGVAIMILSICVVLGFKSEIQGKVMGFGGHIQVLNYETQRSPESVPVVVDDSIMSQLASIPGVRHVQRFCMKPGMLKTDQVFAGVAFKGVGEEYDTSFLADHLTQGVVPAFSDTASTGQMMLSENLASTLGLKLGDRVYAYFFEKSVRARRLTLSGIFCTNLTEYDNQIVFVDMGMVHSLLGWYPDQFSGAEVTVNDLSRLAEVSDEVVNRVNHRQDAYGAYYTSPTIRELNPVIFNWLDLLDMDVLVILILMIAVAGFTMVSGLLIIILEHTNFIGVMKAMGAANHPLRRIFLWLAGMIIVRGLVAGNLLAFVLIFLQQRFGMIHLEAETYYVDTVPLMVHWGYILLVNVATLLLCMLALLLPSYVVSRIDPVRSIRFE